jgi:hypothetical protein
MLRFFSSLRFRLLLLVLLAVVPALGLILYTAAEQREAAVVDAQENALRIARLAASDQERLVEGARQLLTALAQLPSVRNHDEAQCTLFLADLLKQYPLYENLGAIDPNGNIFCSAIPSGRNVNVTDRGYFQHALQKSGFAVGEYLIARITGKATMATAYSVLDERGQLRVGVFAGIDLDWLNQFMATAELPAGSTLTVFDNNGTILVHYPDPQNWVGTPMPTYLSQPILARGEGVNEALGLDGVPRLYAFTPLSSVAADGTYVRIGIPKAVAFADADRTLTRNLVALGLVAMLAFAAAWVGGDWMILRRMKTLLSATKQLGAGDQSARTGLPYDGSELSQLAHAFDQMAEALEQRDAKRQQAEDTLLRQSTRTEALARFTSRLNAQLDLKNVMSTVCEETVNVLKVPAASVSLFDKNRDALYYAMGVGLPPEYEEQTQSILRTISVEYTRQMSPLLVIPDARIYSDPSVDLSAGSDIRTIVSASMWREGQLVGSLNIFTFGQMHRFSEDEMTFLKVLADEAAQAIINARLYDALSPLVTS